MAAFRLGPLNRLNNIGNRKGPMDISGKPWAIVKGPWVISGKP